MEQKLLVWAEPVVCGNVKSWEPAGAAGQRVAPSAHVDKCRQNISCHCLPASIWSEDVGLLSEGKSGDEDTLKAVT